MARLILVNEQGVRSVAETTNLDNSEAKFPDGYKLYLDTGIQEGEWFDEPNPQLCQPGEWWIDEGGIKWVRYHP
jgi:hypothetical protein